MERSKTYILRLKTIRRLNPYHAHRAPLDRTTIIAADGVEIISERPCRCQVVGRFVGCTVDCGIFSGSVTELFHLVVFLHQPNLVHSRKKSVSHL